MIPQFLHKLWQAPKPKGITQAMQCVVCGKNEENEYGKLWAHCGKMMRTTGSPNFPVDNVKELRLHTVIIGYDPGVAWSFPGSPEQIMEVWRLRPGAGRASGEQLGWIGKRTLTYEWHMVPGVAIRNGTGPTPVDCVQMMMIAMDGGASARRILAEVVS